MNRRDFLSTSALLGFCPTVPLFLARAARAGAVAGADDTVLVVLQLFGGNDGLNTVVPFRDPLYYKARPTLAVPKADSIGITDDLAFHPSLKPLAKLFGDKQLSIVQGVGYPNPSQSHFRSNDIWQTAVMAEDTSSGWLGRGLREKELAAFHLSGSGTDSAPLALSGAPKRVPSIGSLAEFQLQGFGATRAARQAHLSAVQATSVAPPVAPMPASGPGSLLDFVERTAAETYASSDRLKHLAQKSSAATYPASSLGTRLKLAAQLIDAGVSARLFYVTQEGYDTHAGQGGAKGVHANLLKDLAESLAAFWADIASRGHGKRVMVMTFSEFGRRVGENGSEGTDHGEAAPLFVLGGRPKSNLIGSRPDLTKAVAQNLPFEIDFRRVYADVLGNWLGIPPEGVLGGKFAPVGLA